MARAIQTRGGDRDTPASWSIRTIRQSNRSCSEDSKKARSTVWNCRRASRRWSGSKKKESGDITAEHRYLAIHRTSLTARFPLRFGRQSLPCGATWASKFLNLQPQYRPLRRIFFECSRLMAQVPNHKLSDGDAQIRHLLAVIRRAAPFSSRPAPPTELPCYERFPRWREALLRRGDVAPTATQDGRSHRRVSEFRTELQLQALRTR